jgi:uncharacterized protein DUF4160
LGLSFECSWRPGITPFSPFPRLLPSDIAIYGIEKIERLAGSLPTRQERLVLAWTELHQGELLANWDKLQGGHPPIKIEPLK